MQLREDAEKDRKKLNESLIIKNKLVATLVSSAILTSKRDRLDGIYEKLENPRLSKKRLKLLTKEKEELKKALELPEDSSDEESGGDNSVNNDGDSVVNNDEAAQDLTSDIQNSK